MRKGYTVTYQMRKQQRQRREKIIGYILKFAAAVFCAFFIVRFLCFSYTIQGDSMAPTFEKGEKHLVNRIIYQVKKPSRYDIIVFKLSEENNKNYYVKRVVGLPGETIEIKDRNVYVNGKKTKLYSKEKILSPGLASEKITLKENQYFVLGDNYNNSEDSRSASIGNVKRSNIVGKASFKYWPWG